MKRLPLAASFLLFIALCASVAYWAMQLFKPPVRPVAAPPRVAAAEVRPEAAAGLFGGRSGPVAVASNYQLKGVIFSGSPHDSIAILSADGKPAQPVRVDAEVAPGVKVKEVHRGYVLLTEGGATKRVELPENAKGQGGIAMTPSAAPVPAQNSAGSGRPGQMMPPATTAPPTMVVSPPPSAQMQPSTNGPGSSATTMPAPGAALPSPVVTPTPVPATPMPITPAPAAPQVPAPAPAPVIVPGQQTTAPSAQPYAPFTNQVPPGTPGPNTPLQSR